MKYSFLHPFSKQFLVLTLYLICQFCALPIQQQIKIYKKIWTNEVQLSD